MAVVIELMWNVLLPCIDLWVYDMGVIVKARVWVDLHLAVLFDLEQVLHYTVY